MLNPAMLGMKRNVPPSDTSETVHISGMALLKMLKHCRSGIPLEVIGLMLGRYVDNYTVQVVDVFPTPQTGNGTSVEAVDPAYQSEMVEMLAQTGREETVIGWYHSHPGFGVWLSGVDIEQQLQWEHQNTRCVAVVVDPVSSVRGKVVIGAFRTIPGSPSKYGEDPRDTASFTGSVDMPSLTTVVHGLNVGFYRLPIAYRLRI